MKKNAIVLTGGFLRGNSAKTAHGLIRGSDRFNIVAIIDPVSAGKDAGEELDGKSRNIPVYADIGEFLEKSTAMAEYCIIGVATKGGVIPQEMRRLLRDALIGGLSLVNGLHEYISDIPELADLARERGLEIADIRKPKKVKDLHFWTGAISKVLCPKVAVLGTDCALGKRTTTRMLTQSMVEKGYKAEMIYTGQTGWMQGARFGFIFDSTLNDFVSGELEHAVVSCYEATRPDIIFIEGQSSLTNPSGPAGAEWIVSAAATNVILQHDPARICYKDMDHYGARIPPVKDVIEMIRMYGGNTIAITVNTAQMSPTDARAWAREQQDLLNVPVILPLEDGVGQLVPLFEEMIAKATLVKQSPSNSPLH